MFEANKTGYTVLLQTSHWNRKVLPDVVCLWYSSAGGSSVTVSAPPVPTAPSCVTDRILSWSSRILPLVPFLIGLLTPPPGVAAECGGRVPELLGAGVWGFAGSWRLWGFDQLGVDHGSGRTTICLDGQPAPSAVGFPAGFVVGASERDVFAGGYYLELRFLSHCAVLSLTAVVLTAGGAGGSRWCCSLCTASVCWLCQWWCLACVCVCVCVSMHA